MFAGWLSVVITTAQAEAGGGRLESRTAATSSLVGRIVGDVFFSLTVSVI